MIYADYVFYALEYHGKLIPEENYEALATKASAFVDYYTMGKARNIPEHEAVKMACCACAEIYAGIESTQAQMVSGGELASESVGSYSRTYRSSADVTASMNARLAEAVQMYLAPTGLLYRGVKCTLRM